MTESHHDSGHLQEGSEGGFRELQVCWADLDTGEGYREDHLECHHMQDNQGIRLSQHGKGRLCLTNLTSFYDKVKSPAMLSPLIFQITEK